MVAEDIRNLLGFYLPPHLTQLVLGAAVALQGVASLTFILGYFVQASAIVLILFLLPVTFMVHDFWTVPDAPRPLEPQTKEEAAEGKTRERDDTHAVIHRRASCCA